MNSLKILRKAFWGNLKESLQRNEFLNSRKNLEEMTEGITKGIEDESPGEILFKTPVDVSERTFSESQKKVVEESQEKSQ